MEEQQQQVGLAVAHVTQQVPRHALGIMTHPAGVPDVPGTAGDCLEAAIMEAVMEAILEAIMEAIMEATMEAANRTIIDWLVKLQGPCAATGMQLCEPV